MIGWTSLLQISSFFSIPSKIKMLLSTKSQCILQNTVWLCFKRKSKKDLIIFGNKQKIRTKVELRQVKEKKRTMMTPITINLLRKKIKNLWNNKKKTRKKKKRDKIKKIAKIKRMKKMMDKKKERYIIRKRSRRRRSIKLRASLNLEKVILGEIDHFKLFF